MSAPDTIGDDAAMEPFSVGLFLGTVGKDSYIPLFRSRGYVTSAKCARLTELDLASMGIRCNHSPWRSDYAGIFKIPFEIEYTLACMLAHMSRLGLFRVIITRNILQNEL